MRARSKVKTLLLQPLALRKFYVIKGQNARDQIVFVSLHSIITLRSI